MRIAVDCHMVGQPRAGDAGNGRYAARLVAALLATRSDGDEVAAFTAYPEARTLLPGARHLAVPRSNVRRLALAAPRHAAAARLDAALFHYVAPPVRTCRQLLVIHDPSFLLFPEWIDRRARWLLRAAVPVAARRADMIVAVSHAAKQDLVAALRLEPERVHVVRTHPAPVFTPDGQAADRVHERFGLRRYLLAVGDVNPRKNLVALAEAVATLGRPDLELALVGRPGFRGREILSRCRARWLGHVTDEELADLYRAAAVTAYPSLYEGFGIPVLEALACGSPVVASRRGAIPEAAGDAAILVEPDVQGLAEGIRAALEPAESDRLRAAGPRQAASFSVEATGQAGWAAFRAAATAEPAR